MQQRPNDKGSADAGDMADDKAVRDAKHLLFLAHLFSRAADLIMGAKYLGHPITVAAALLEALRGKLLRGELTRQDVDTVPLLLQWVGSEMIRGSW